MGQFPYFPYLLLQNLGIIPSYTRHVVRIMPMLTELHGQWSVCFINVAPATFTGNATDTLLSVVDLFLACIS
jgi:hypothetical protein